jgi:ubiquinone/menaquinone biosynthesis C-methylase UbiE
MGEIFKKELPNSILPFTGERFTDGHDIETEIEHYHRYFFARSYCRGKDVLDIASGEGYGAAILAQVASSVVGVDICDEAVSHAQNVHARSNLRYLTGDVRKIPLEDNSVDVVVSFETLEHFYEHDLFMQEVKRVLRPDGCLIISTPNSDIYSAVGIPANPYHVNELTKTEFTSLCKKYFKCMKTVNQRALVGSVLIGDSDADAAGLPIVFESRDKEYVECSNGLSRAFYLISVLSDKDDVTVHNSIYINESTRDLLNGRIQAFHQALEEKSRHIINLEIINVDKSKHIENIENSLLEKNKHINNLENDVLNKKEHIESIENILYEKNKYMDNLENDVLNKNMQIENIENIFLEKNKYIEVLENYVLNKNKHIERMKSILLEKNQHLEESEAIFLR